MADRRFWARERTFVPPPKYWVSVSAAAFLLLFFFTVWMAYSGWAASVITAPAALIFAAVAALVVLFGLWDNAQREYRTHRADVSNGLLHKKIDEQMTLLRAQAENFAAIRVTQAELQTEPATTDDDFENPAKLTAPQLRRLALTFASELRLFEASHMEEEDVRNAKEWNSRGGTEEQRNASWRAAREADGLARANYTKEFKTKFLAKAAALKDSLCKLLGISAEEASRPPYHSVAIDDGMLAGVNPIAEAAGVIEKLARQLG